MKINNIKNSQFIQNAPIKRVQNNNMSLTYNQRQTKADTFQMSPNFKGIKLPSGEYSIHDVRMAKRYVADKNETWKEAMYKRVYERQKNSHSAIIGPSSDKIGKKIDRVNVDIVTLGLGEIYFQLRKANDKQIAKNAVLKMNKIVNDVKNLKFKEDAAEIKKTELATTRALQYQKGLNTAKETVIKPKLLDLIQRKREGRPTAMPNNVMFYSKDKAVNDNLINWTKENANANVKTVDLNKDDLLDVLEKAEDDYQKTGDWNLIHAKNMEDYINPKKVDRATIEAMKDFMSATADDYHTTLMFSTNNPEELDYIALQPHRVKNFDFSGVKSNQTADIEDAKARVRNPENVKETPLSVINDLLFIANKNHDKKLDWEFSLSDNVYREARDNAINKFIKEDNPEGVEFMTIFTKAHENLV